MAFQVYEYEPVDINFREEQNLGIDLICHQLDEVVLNFNMWNGSEAEDMRDDDYFVELRVHKPDNTDYIQGKTNIHKGNGTLRITCSDQMTAASGMCKGELRVFNNVKKQRTSRIFHIKIIPSVVEVDRSISQTTITVMEELKVILDYAYELVEALKNMEDKIEEAKQVIALLNTALDRAQDLFSKLAAENRKADNNIAALQQLNQQAQDLYNKLKAILDQITKGGLVIIAETLPPISDRAEGNLYIQILGEAGSGGLPSNPSIPNPPVDPNGILKAALTSSNQVNLTWKDGVALKDTGITWVALTRSEDNYTSWILGASDTDNNVIYRYDATNDYQDRSFLDTNVTPGATYYYRLYAMTSRGLMCASTGEVTITIPAASQPAPPPTSYDTNITGLMVYADQPNGLKIKWSDPNDANWGGTKLVYNYVRYPQNVDDGTLVIDNTVRDKYKTQPYNANLPSQPDGLYYRFFPYSKNGIISTTQTNNTLMFCTHARANDFRVTNSTSTSLSLRWSENQIIQDANHLTSSISKFCLTWGEGKFPTNTNVDDASPQNKLEINNSSDYDRYKDQDFVISGLKPNTIYTFILWHYSGNSWGRLTSNYVRGQTAMV